MKRTTKLLMTGAILFAVTFASAALMPYYNKETVEGTSVQGIMIDDKPWNEPIVDVIDHAIGGCCYCFEHYIDYDEEGCGCQYLIFAETSMPTGITVTFRELCGEERMACECHCYCPEMEMPIRICPGERIYYCTCYYFDPLFAPGPFSGTAGKLIPAPAPEEL